MWKRKGRKDRRTARPVPMELCDLCARVFPEDEAVSGYVPDSSAAHLTNEWFDGLRRITACCDDHFDVIKNGYTHRPFVDEELWAAKLTRALTTARRRSPWTSSAAGPASRSRRYAQPSPGTTNACVSSSAWTPDSAWTLMRPSVACLPGVLRGRLSPGAWSGRGVPCTRYGSAIGPLDLQAEPRPTRVGAKGAAVGRQGRRRTAAARRARGRGSTPGAAAAHGAEGVWADTAGAQCADRSR